MTSPIGKRASRAGYTLIELVLLAVILAILIAIATPQFRRTFTGLTVKDASFNISKLISFAQEKSILEKVQYKLVLDVDENAYCLMRQAAGTSAGYKKVEEHYGRRFTLPANTKLKSDKKEITFYPDGHSDKATIALVGRDGVLKIVVKGSLGYVEIETDEKK